MNRTMVEHASAVMGSLLIAGCASTGPQPPMGIPAEVYSRMSCDEINVERERIQQTVQRVGDGIDSQAGSNVALVAMGLVTFWPALLFVGRGSPYETEYLQAAKELETVISASLAKDCHLPPEERGKPNEFLPGLRIQTGDLTVAPMPSELPANLFVVGNRAINAPLGRWYFIDRTSQTISGREYANGFSYETQSFAKTAVVSMLRVSGNGSMSAVVRVEVPLEHLRYSAWDLEPCKVEAIHRNTFKNRRENPECLSVARVSADSSVASSAFRWGRSHRLTSESGYYDIRYSYYGIRSFANISITLPTSHFTSDKDAIDWSTAFAKAMRPMSESGRPMATIPPL